MGLTYMQQTVIITAMRAPDGIKKHHPIKTLSRWLRRCVLRSAFDGRVLWDPYEEGGGSFMGPCKTTEVTGIDHAVELYIQSGDEIPLHFFFHFMQAVEILGYKYPDRVVRLWWQKVYHRLVAFCHLNIETEIELDRRLSDNELEWKAREA